MQLYNRTASFFSFNAVLFPFRRFFFMFGVPPKKSSFVQYYKNKRLFCQLFNVAFLYLHCQKNFINLRYRYSLAIVTLWLFSRMQGTGVLDVIERIRKTNQCKDSKYEKIECWKLVTNLDHWKAWLLTGKLVGDIL